MKHEATVVDVAAGPSSGTKGGMVVAARNGMKGNRGIGIIDFLLRLAAIAAAITAAATMGTSEQTLPIFSQFSTFQAGYDDLPTFTFFVAAMALVGGYLVLSLPFSIITIVRPQASTARLLLLILDTVAVTFAAAAASAAAAIVYLAHYGNNNLNWFPICQQFGDFCQQISGAVVAAFISVAFIAFSIILSAVSLKSH